MHCPLWWCQSNSHQLVLSRDVESKQTFLMMSSSSLMIINSTSPRWEPVCSPGIWQKAISQVQSMSQLKVAQLQKWAVTAMNANFLKPSVQRSVVRWMQPGAFCNGISVEHEWDDYHTESSCLTWLNHFSYDCIIASPVAVQCGIIMLVRCRVS
jgi:hypothetical protein